MRDKNGLPLSSQEFGPYATAARIAPMFDEKAGEAVEWCWVPPVRSYEPMPSISGVKATLLRFARYLSTIYLREPWWAEFWSGLIGIAWGVTFFLSGADVFDRPFLILLGQISETTIWAWFCLSVGLCQLIFLLLDVRAMRWISAFIMSWFPCVVVISFLIDTPVTPTVAVYGGWAGINLFSIFRLLRRAS
jgi:signal transduction histidine kinase